MTELERALAALGNELEYPQSRDVWPHIADRLQRRSWLRPALFGVAVSVERVDNLPSARTRPFATGLGPAQTAPTVELPAALSATAYYKGPGMAAALFRYQGTQVLYARLRGDQMGFEKKFVSPTTHVREAPIGEFGMWFDGSPHVLSWEFGEIHTRLAGNALVWLSRGVPYRLEGQLDEREMLALARQITR
jgi:hypothetical protein